MVGNVSKPKSHEGAWLWLAKIVAGLVIVVILGIHLVINHMVVPGGLLTYQDVVQYYTNDIVIVMEAIFLVFVIGHSFLGIRSIILDLNPSRAILRVVNVVLAAVGVFAIVYGIWLIAVIRAKG